MPVLFRALLLLAVAAPAAADVTDRFTRVVAIPPGTPITLQITIGDVHITGWDRADVSIEIVRHAPDSQQLTRIPVLVNQGTDGLSIRAVQPEAGRDAALRTDVVLRVPSAAQLGDLSVFEGRVQLADLRGVSTAHLERGGIVARNLTGTIRLETAMGDIRLEGTTLAAGGLVRLRTFNGDIVLELAARPDHARILALSLGGTITSDIPLTRQERWGPRFGEATLGRGDPLISIDVVNGNIAIKVAGAGR